MKAIIVVIMFVFLFVLTLADAALAAPTSSPDTQPLMGCVKKGDCDKGLSGPLSLRAFRLGNALLEGLSAADRSTAWIDPLKGEGE